MLSSIGGVWATWKYSNPEPKNAETDLPINIKDFIVEITVLFSMVKWNKRSELPFSPQKAAEVIILIWMGSTNKKRFSGALQNSCFYNSKHSNYLRS